MPKRLPISVFASLWTTLILGSALFAVSTAPAAEPPMRPNVLFIVVDDLNDWVGVLGGHAQTKTPHIDRLAKGGILFVNAHCTAPLCNPSRTSVLTGRRPTTSGVCGNNQDWRKVPSLKGVATLPQYFRQHGYWTAGGGKIFHANHGGPTGALSNEEGAKWGGRRGFGQPEAWDVGFLSKDVQLPLAPVLIGTHRNGINHHWDWGPIDHDDDATEDGQISRWAVLQLEKKHDKPFFLAVGIYKPHDPQYAPAEYFNDHPLEQVVLPTIKEDDLEDVPTAGKRYTLHAGSDWHRMIVQHDALRSAVRAYLASITFADAMVGRVLDALEKSPYVDDTIVCLWSDHGYHLGEKRKYHKSTLWEEATRVPLIVVAPGVAGKGSVCRLPVSLVDIYPTLLELCGLPPPEGLDGTSLVPLMRDPNSPRVQPAITTRAGGHHAVRSEYWRYIRYANGSEELYNHGNDPNEWTNLADRPEYVGIKQQLAKWLPYQN